ncbi:MAG: hypothetical protein ABMA64_08340 [Myxococcota bacterium]
MTAAAGPELFSYTFATWVFTLHVGGVRPADERVAAACDAVRAAADEGTGNAAGAALVEQVRALVPDAAPATFEAAARRLYGERLRTDLGAGDREHRTAAVRRYQFGAQLPWLARIWQRQDGAVAPVWWLVERVTDEVRAADPNPWNDVDEAPSLPVADFQVLWELDGCTSLHLG